VRGLLARSGLAVAEIPEELVDRADRGILEEDLQCRGTPPGGGVQIGLGRVVELGRIGSE